MCILHMGPLKQMWKAVLHAVLLELTTELSEMILCFTISTESHFTSVHLITFAVTKSIYVFVRHWV
jgi:hypothetical protein